MQVCEVASRTSLTAYNASLVEYLSTCAIKNFYTADIIRAEHFNIVVYVRLSGFCDQKKIYFGIIFLCKPFECIIRCKTRLKSYMLSQRLLVISYQINVKITIWGKNRTATKISRRSKMVFRTTESI